MTIHEAEDIRNAASSVNKFLTFDLGKETYGIDILQIREIIGITNITAVPQAPDYVRGVMNLRGKIIPVADLRRRLGFPSTQDTERTCIIVADVEGARIQVGLVVDAVSEVAQIAPSDVEAPPSIGEDSRDKYIQGLAKLKDKVVILLDIDRVLAGAMGEAFDPA